MRWPIGEPDARRGPPGGVGPNDLLRTRGRLRGLGRGGDERGRIYMGLVYDESGMKNGQWAGVGYVL